MVGILEDKPIFDEKAAGLLQYSFEHILNAVKGAVLIVVFGAAILFFYEHSKFYKDTTRKPVEFPKNPNFDLWETDQRTKFREDITAGVKQAMKET